MLKQRKRQIRAREKGGTRARPCHAAAFRVTPQGCICNNEASSRIKFRKNNKKATLFDDKQVHRQSV